MAWKPLNKKHSIERVCIVIQFSDTLSLKYLDQITESDVNFRSKYGFNQIEQVHGIPNAELPPLGSRFSIEDSQKGLSIKRMTEESVVEEANFRSGSFSYVSVEYERWKNLEQRFFAIFQDPVSKVLNNTDILSIKLQYWNKFIFGGQYDEASLSTVLEVVDPTFPDEVIAGKTLWHSHIGWFEKLFDQQVLINRNIGVVDEKSEQDFVRVLNIYTLTDLRPDNNFITIQNIKKVLGSLHNKSGAVFGNTIPKKLRKEIGLSLDDYT